MDLFSSLDSNNLAGTPLAERLRPLNFADFVAQDKIQKALQDHIRSGHVPNLILWGPPGTGKTTLARILSQQLNFEFVPMNAVESGAKALKAEGDKARERRRLYNQRTLLFVDEIHRFNKAQQDVLLPYIENGDLNLIGATTENPSYELNRALLSRCKLMVLERLSAADLRKIFLKGCQQLQKSPDQLLVADAQDLLLAFSDGDARRLLTALEDIAHQPDLPMSSEAIRDLLGKMVLGYDKKSDQHYDVISAFIKSIRGSDADAGLYYLARMIQGGEDASFIARRLVILASEDVGNADPRALSVAVAAAQAVEMIGLPEAAINLAQAVTYLSSAPKSNRSYLAWKKAQAFVESTGTQEIPLALRSDQTSEMKGLGYGTNYLYPHDYPKSFVEQNYWPEKIKAQVFYQPNVFGFEKQIHDYQRWLRAQVVTSADEKNKG